ncbi:uncharacterized protein LOC131291084 [Anopheles ziemanni]|uniref:uncharacterized protein LOC131291084 n=1 Tax=Anopheles ziemanni TaxID=345580 RepID=UPI002659450B|nr:uncharacterized protein LOC131268839 isoform X2 [Anopheles coustani]XP_058176257.1 uncharacterized protein LOC131291084 [Anopheles ziemanni]
MKKFMSTKAAAAPPPPPPATSTSSASSSDPSSTFATFEALLRAANPSEHPASRTMRTIGASNRKITPKPRPPPTPVSAFSFDYPPCSDDDGSPEKRPETQSESPPRHRPEGALSPATSASTPSLASPSSSPMTATTKSTSGVIKMSGYLKKKRNKMGGWRKLFFILQNQLLLSYSSRDDYEKKLAPFKDIINLVPGTRVIPTTGPRFTIETNSKVMYTFRCDDQGSCSEWIMALLDSLNAINGGVNMDRSFSPQNIFQRSTLPLASIALPPRGKLFDRTVQRQRSDVSSAIGAIAPPKPPRSFTSSVRPPQQQQTRGRETPPEMRRRSEDALNNNIEALSKSAAEDDTTVSSDRSSNTGETSVKSKIIAFETQANLQEAQETVPSKNSRNATGISCSGEGRQEEERQACGTDGRHGKVPCNEGAEDGDRWKWWLRERQSEKQRQEQREGGGSVLARSSAAIEADECCNDGTEAKVEQDEPQREALAEVDATPEDGEEVTDEEEQEEEDDGEEEEEEESESAGTQQKIFRLHPDVWRKTHQSVDVCRINSMFGERTAPGTPAALESVGGAQQHSNVTTIHPVSSDEENHRDTATRKLFTSSCSALPSVALSQPVELPVGADTSGENPYATPAGESGAVYADVRDYRKPRAELRETASEPIYAVVDICAKRTRRAARQTLQGPDETHTGTVDTTRSPFVSVSLPQIPTATGSGHRPAAKRCYSNNNNDYEDVNDFLDRLEEDERDARRPENNSVLLYGDDHIYEPIQVPERIMSSDTSGSSTSLPASSSSGPPAGGNSLWKQLKRMHLQGSRHRLALRRVFAGKAAAAVDQARTANQSASESDGGEPGGRSPSTLEGFGRRLDSHRRSIKKRIKSLYDRGSPSSTRSPSSSGTFEYEQRSSGPADAPEAEAASSEAFNRSQGTRQSRKSLSLDSFLSTANGRTHGTATDQLRARLLIETKTK